MKVKKIENLVGIALDVNVDDFEKVKKYAPEALKIVDEEGNEKFAVDGTAGMFCGSVMGELSDWGAMFTEVGDKMIIWMGVPSEHLKDAKEWMVEHSGMALAHLKDVEAQIKGAIEAANKKVESIEDTISEIEL